MRNLLYCKGCNHLCSKVTFNLESMYCNLDKKLKVTDKKAMWYNIVIPAH